MQVFRKKRKNQEDKSHPRHLASVHALLLAALAAPSAAAADLTLSLTNQAGVPVSSIAATPSHATDSPPISLLAAVLPPGEQRDVLIPVADTTCVFDLSISFTSGMTVSRPNTDLCQTDALIIE